MSPRKIEHAAYTVDEFCEAYRISRRKLYKLWEDGKGPRALRDGKWTVITIEDAQAWARRDNASAA